MDSTASTTNSNREYSLVGAQLPADRGLSALGLVMQLVGAVGMGVMALVVVSSLDARGSAWIAIAIGTMGLMRSSLHRSAGSALLYGSATGPMKPIKTYIVFSVVQTALSLLVLKSEFETRHLIALAAVFLAWPAALTVIITRPWARSFASEVPDSEDRGYEGIAVLMTVFGAVGLLFSTLIVVGMVKAGTYFGSVTLFLITALSLVFVARSMLHLRAGVEGVRGLQPDHAMALASRYWSVGMLSSVLTGAVFALQGIMSPVFVPSFILVAIIALSLLLAWPLAVRRFFTERNFAMVIEGKSGPLFRRAPDAGLTALGWVLLLGGVSSLSVNVGGLFTDSSSSALVPGLTLKFSVLGVATGVAQLWAALELIAMSPRYRVAAALFGVLGVGVALYTNWPMFQYLDGLGRIGLSMNYGEWGVMALQLVLPAVTLALVFRQHLPEARAKILA